jgi:hypothetical protein
MYANHAGGVEGEEEGGAGAANDKRKGNKSKASGGKSSGDGIGRAPRDSAKDEAAFESHKLLCQIGSPDTVASSIQAIKRFTKKRTFSPSPEPEQPRARARGGGRASAASRAREDEEEDLWMADPNGIQ